MLITVEEMKDRIDELAEELWSEQHAPDEKLLDCHTDAINQITQHELDQMDEDVSGYVAVDEVDEYFYNYAIKLVNECSDITDSWKVYIDYEAFADDLLTDYS